MFMRDGGDAGGMATTGSGMFGDGGGKPLYDTSGDSGFIRAGSKKKPATDVTNSTVELTPAGRRLAKSSAGGSGVNQRSFY